ncbi:hypothetical protein P280DRAFT_520397 [Massarina eburnea CBS 473.64]|uniref:Uncharacterized protein n=1 Tax=Massarina eburnea CBS 473.64 TaxID=1395130 RepID=A0A6A6RT64_9PLEO|nr:hypothetical protein P280DRAFT_520397 [Massarina eburnea CBS 473.64]
MLSNTSTTQLAEEALHDKPLRGLPSKIKVDGVYITFGPHLPARRAAEAYLRSIGKKPVFPRVYTKLNRDRSTRIAQLYEELQPTPQDQLTVSAYSALISETLAQWEYIKATGLKVEFNPNGKDPYGNPRNAVLDVVNNNHLYILPTRFAFGDSEFCDNTDANIMVTETSTVIDGQVMLVNDIFRIVHDYFGHVKEGNGFRAEGEDNAYRCHAAMYSPLARRALASDLRGQNCWVNWGPWGEHNRKANGGDTIFAPQKMGLLPEWVAEEGVEDPLE